LKTAHVVLGMHRSGTSSVAGTLALLGAAPPRTLMQAAPENPKGFWESEVLMVVNDALLAACGSRWDDWHPVSANAQERLLGSDLADRASAALEAEFGDADIVVLKDPRICRIYGFWRGVLARAGYRPVVTIPVRAPGEVARSLQTRNAFTTEFALALWLRHVLDAEVGSRDDRRHVFDWSALIGDWRATVADIDRHAGVHLSAAARAKGPAVDDFLSRDLRHHLSSECDPLPERVRTTWHALLDLSRDPGHAGARLRLDEVRHAFDQACREQDDPALALMS